MQAPRLIQDASGCVSKLRVVIPNMYCEFSDKRYYKTLARFEVHTATFLNIKSDVMP
jgi:hypothetical protein